MCFGFTSRIRLFSCIPWLAAVTFPAVSREPAISNENHCLRSVIELSFTYAKDIRMLMSVDMQASDTSARPCSTVSPVVLYLVTGIGLDSANTPCPVIAEPGDPCTIIT